MACARATQTPFIGQPTPRGDARSLSVVAAATACSFLPLSTAHRVALLIGAVGFLLAQALQPSIDRARKLAPTGRPNDGRSAATARPSSPHGQQRQQRRQPSAKAAEKAPAEPPRKAGVWTPSAVPVQAPTFSGRGWEAEVEELLLRLTPTAETTEAVAEVANAVKRVVKPILPGVEVTGFVGAGLSSSKAFGVAVPEVDIVVSATPGAMASLAGRRCRRPGKQGQRERTPLELRKSVVRACTARLTSDAGFKFRRSALRVEEPKMVLISPPALRSVPMNLSVNTVTPVYNAAFLAECARLEPRAQGLVLLVKRWAKDRGLCHVARGHLSLYWWTLLPIYFLQVGEGGLLPPLQGAMSPSDLAARCLPFASPSPVSKMAVSNRRAPAGQGAEGSAVTVGGLLRAFFRFYGARFDWRAEAVSLRAGTRGALGVWLPLHVICDEDPFGATRNLGMCVTSASLRHLRAEFERADRLCGRGASLAELLEPWAPQVGAASRQAYEDVSEE